MSIDVALITMMICGTICYVAYLYRGGSLSARIEDIEIDIEELQEGDAEELKERMNEVETKILQVSQDLSDAVSNLSRGFR